MSIESKVNAPTLEIDCRYLICRPNTQHIVITDNYIQNRQHKYQLYKYNQNNILKLDEMSKILIVNILLAGLAV